jgi:hypothetical protein
MYFRTMAFLQVERLAASVQRHTSLNRVGLQFPVGHTTAARSKTRHGFDPASIAG